MVHKKSGPGNTIKVQEREKAITLLQCGTVVEFTSSTSSSLVQCSPESASLLNVGYTIGIMADQVTRQLYIQGHLS